MKSYLSLIIGMGIATYIPRLVPLLFLTDKEVNPKLRRFLQYIPYTSLTILIIRGIVTADSNMILPTIVGIALAGIVSYFKSNLVLSVIVSIAASFIIINII